MPWILAVRKKYVAGMWVCPLFHRLVPLFSRDDVSFLSQAVHVGMPSQLDRWSGFFFASILQAFSQAGWRGVWKGRAHCYGKVIYTLTLFACGRRREGQNREYKSGFGEGFYQTEVGNEILAASSLFSSFLPLYGLAWSNRECLMVLCNVKSSRKDPI